jgi:drug/metabolite transporter (DMT)-like permease
MPPPSAASSRNAAPALAAAGAARTAVFAGGALTCFAANSLLCRAALGPGLADAGTFTAVRLASGAAVLALLLAARRARPAGGSWGSAAALFAYAAAFSLAYLRIGAAVGALVLFPAVQATMVGWGVATGATLARPQWAGMALALVGLGWLTLPRAGGSPDLAGAVLMALAGVAWGVYSVRGRRATEPLATTADNFVRATPLGLAFLAAHLPAAHASPAGIALAVVSGALASGGGYALWYAVLPALGPSRAGTLQLATPALAAAGAVLLLGEPLTARLAGAGALILGGVALAVVRPRAR